MALLGALTWQYARAQKGARYYLPDEVVDALPSMRQGSLVNAKRVIQGVCLATDAENFASVAENMMPHDRPVPGFLSDLGRSPKTQALRRP